MISQEHLDALRDLRSAAQDLSLVCTSITGTAALVHMAFDRGASPTLTDGQSALVRKLRSVK